MLTRSRSRDSALTAESERDLEVVSALATPEQATAPPPERSDRLRITWVGHSTFLIQCSGVNLLTDPVWSDRVSPVSFAGPRRLRPPGVAFENLPPIDAVLVSHDHYDHLDDRTVRQIIARFPAARWFVPLRVGAFLERRGAAAVTELDWWDELGQNGWTLACTPAQHFSGRYPWNRNATLWCGWTIAFDHASLFFGGDTALHPEFRDIAERLGPFDAAILPIGAYEPRWFMRTVHMSPEDSVAAFTQLLKGRSHKPCVMVGSHWGTFRLTDEPVSEPPKLTRAAWQAAALDPARLWILAHGESRELDL